MSIKVLPSVSHVGVGDTHLATVLPSNARTAEHRALVGDHAESPDAASPRKPIYGGGEDLHDFQQALGPMVTQAKTLLGERLETAKKGFKKGLIWTGVGVAGAVTLATGLGMVAQYYVNEAATKNGIAAALKKAGAPGGGGSTVPA